MPVNNHFSVDQHHTAVKDKLTAELAAGRVAGPFKSPPFHQFIVSPLKLVPKKTEGESRLIHNLSFPHFNDLSVNAGIDPFFAFVSYETFDDCLAIIQDIGLPCYIAKSDLADAYRNLPLSKDSYHLMGFVFEGNYYYDKCLAMGASSSCQTFEYLSTALQWISKSRLGVPHMSHILDDFIFFGKTNSICAKSQSQFELLCKDINLPLRAKKKVTATTCCELHGLQVDTVAGTVTLPADKWERAVDMLQGLRGKKKVTLHDLQCCLGLLQFCCRAVEAGRAFLRRLIDLTLGVTRPNHHIHMNNEARKDINTWLVLLEHFGRTSIMKQRTWTSANSVKLYSDSSDLGWGLVYGDKWAYGEWPALWKEYDINIRELYPISLAMGLFGESLKGQRILFCTDNQAVAYSVRKQTSRSPVMMRLLRGMIVNAIKFNFCFSAKWIPGVTNVVCDRLSRLCVLQALESAPWLSPDPVDVHPSLLPWDE